MGNRLCGGADNTANVRIASVPIAPRARASYTHCPARPPERLQVRQPASPRTLPPPKGLPGASVRSALLHSGRCGKSGVKTPGPGGPFPLPSPLASSRRRAWSVRPGDLHARGGEKWACSRAANRPRPRCPEEAPAPGQRQAGLPLPAAKYKCARARRLAPLACTARPVQPPPAAAAPPPPPGPPPRRAPGPRGPTSSPRSRGRRRPRLTRAPGAAHRPRAPRPPPRARQTPVRSRLPPQPLPLTVPWARTALPRRRTVPVSPPPPSSPPVLSAPSSRSHLRHPSGPPRLLCLPTGAAAPPGLRIAPCPCASVSLSSRPLRPQSRLSTWRPGPGARKDDS